MVAIKRVGDWQPHAGIWTYLLETLDYNALREMLFRLWSCILHHKCKQIYRLRIRTLYFGDRTVNMLPRSK